MAGGCLDEKSGECHGGQEGEQRGVLVLFWLSPPSVKPVKVPGESSSSWAHGMVQQSQGGSSPSVNVL